MLNNSFLLKNKAINECSIALEVKRLTTLWANTNTYLPFNELPEQCQTAVASVFFQYGDLAKRTPNFWRKVTESNCSGALNNLRNFGDKYPTRRHKEADLLAEVVS